MKTIYLTATLLFLCQGMVWSQSTAKVYNSFSEVVNDEHHLLPKVYIEKRTTNQIFMSGGGDYKLFTGDKATDKKIKKEYKALTVNDSLYINLKGLLYKKQAFGGWFAPGFCFNKRIYFSSYPLKNIKTSAMFGVVGGAINAAEIVKKRVYYELEPVTGTIQFINIDRLKELVTSYPELQKQLEEEKELKDLEKINKYIPLLRDQK